MPFESRTALPESLRPFIASGNETPFEPIQRNIYDLAPAARRQVQQLELAAAEREWAEAQASEPLRPDVAAALAASHDIAIGRAKAQAQYNQDVIDAAYEQAAAEAAQPPQLYVKRGGAWGRFKTPNSSPANTSS